MTPKQVMLVKQSWQTVQPLGDAVAELFYARLFELEPSLRAMFKNDMRSQGRMLTSVINLAVSKLDQLPALVPALHALGARHVGYGVRDEHYGIVGAALLDTLALGLKDAFTPEVKEAWTVTYTILADTMQAGAAQAPVKRAA